MKKTTYNKPEVLVRHITLGAPLADSPVTPISGEEVGFGDGEARENDAWTDKGNDIWED